MMRRICCLALLFCLAILPAALPGSGEAAVQPPLTAYFPVGENYVWEFAGEGIEFAAFTRRVEFRRGDRVQMSQWNGGTRLMNIYRVTAHAVTQTFSQAEIYDNPPLFDNPATQSVIVLKAPLAVGAAWQNAQDRREILSVTSSLQLPAGAFDNVLIVKTVSTAKADTDNGYTLEYYAPNIGLVMQEYYGANNFKVVSRLKSFQK
jgi:hypothetical protein